MPCTILHYVFTCWQKNVHPKHSTPTPPSPSPCQPPLRASGVNRAQSMRKSVVERSEHVSHPCRQAGRQAARAATVVGGRRRRLVCNAFSSLLLVPLFMCTVRSIFVPWLVHHDAFVPRTRERKTFALWRKCIYCFFACAFSIPHVFNSPSRTRKHTHALTTLQKKTQPTHEVRAPCLNTWTHTHTHTHGEGGWWREVTRSARAPRVRFVWVVWVRWATSTIADTNLYIICTYVRAHKSAHNTRAHACAHR